VRRRLSVTKPSVVSVCIPTRNRSGLLAECLASILDQGFPLDRLEVLVFDDASEPAEAEANQRSVEELRGRGFARVRLERSETNVLMLAGRQRLVELSSGEFLLFLDDDGALERDTLSVLVSSMGEDASLGAVGPRIVGAGPERPVLHPAAFIHPWTGTYSMRDADSPLLCDWLNTTCLLVRRDAFLESGGFDASFRQAHGEADVCLALKSRGRGVLYQPRAEAVHKIAPSLMRRERFYHLYRNKLWVIRRHFPGPRRFSALGVHAVFGTARHLVESISYNRGIVPGECRVIFKALWDGLFGMWSHDRS